MIIIINYGILKKQNKRILCKGDNSRKGNNYFMEKN